MRVKTGVKKTLLEFGKIALNKKHPFYSQLNCGFKYSPLLQETITFAGQLSCSKGYRNRKPGAGIIGSGAIESAHKTVVQERLKLPGQRWNNKGAQNVLNLRAAHKSRN